jgi:hypothetical protein
MNDFYPHCFVEPSGNSYLYQKARKCYFASASTVCGAEAPAEAALVRALAKNFLAV